MIVTTTDRTIEKLEAQAFRPEWLRVVLDDVDDGFLVESAEEIAYINRAYTLLLGYDEPQELLGRHLSGIVAEQDAARLLEFGRLRARFEHAPRSYTFAGRRRDASAVQLRASVSTSRIAERLVIATVIGAVSPTLQPPAATAQSGMSQKRISRREAEVMEMILAGKRMKEIAFILQLSPKTVSTHRRRLLGKLNLSDNRGLFQYALRHGLIDWS